MTTDVVEKTGTIQTVVEQNMEFLKYVVIGGGAAAIDLGLFILFHNLLDWHSVASHSVSVATAVVFSFSLNALWNFGTTDRIGVRFALFVGVAFVGYMIGLAVIAGFEQTSIPQAASLGKVASMPVVFLAQFFLNRQISFRDFDIEAGTNV